MINMNLTIVKLLLLPTVCIFLANANIITRLPNTVLPLDYEIYLQTDLDEIYENHQVSAYGDVNITIRVVENGKNIIYLHRNPSLYLNEIKVINQKTQENLYANIISLNHDIIGLNLTKNLELNQQYSIQFVNFTTNFQPHSSDGWLFLSYEIKNTTGNFYEYFLITQMQPSSARSLFPCFDEPKFKSTVSLTITSNSRYNIISNMPVIQNCTISGKFKTCSFEKSIPMSIYNVVFGVLPFSYRERCIDNNRICFRIWARDSVINQTELALNSTIKILQLCEKEFNIKFPLSKIDSIAVPSLEGFIGMEHYGMITYSEPVLIWSPDIPLTYSHDFVVLIIAHEIIHQWFGNLVTTKWWNDLWLNEGITTFYSYKMTGKIIDENNYYENKRLNTFAYVRKYDDDVYDQNDYITYSNFTNPIDKFSYLSYQKGAIVVDMLQRYMGPEQFRKALIHYLSVYSYLSVDTSDLFRILKQYKPDIELYFQDFLNKKNYPTIIATKINDTVFVNLFNNDQKKNNENWNLKLSYCELTTNKNPCNQIKIGNYSKYRIQLTNSSNYIIFNSNLSLFLGVSYDNVYLKSLIEIFQTNHSQISILDRYQLIQDLYDLSLKYNENNLDLFLSLLQYTSKERDNKVLSLILKLIDKLDSLLKYYSFYLDWLYYLRSILNYSFNKLLDDFQEDFVDYNSYSTDVRIKLLYLACKIRLDLCDTISDVIYERFQNQTSLMIDYDLMHLAFCNIIERDKSGEKWLEFNKMNYFDSWDSIVIKYYALGCSKVPWVISKLNHVTFPSGKNTKVIFGNRIGDHQYGIIGPIRMMYLSFSLNNPILIIQLLQNNNRVFEILDFLTQHAPKFPIPDSLVETILSTYSHLSISREKELFANSSMLKLVENCVNWIGTNKLKIENYLTIEQYKNIKTL